MILSSEKRRQTPLLLFFLFSIFFISHLTTLLYAQPLAGQTRAVKIEKIYNEENSLRVGFSFINFFTGDLLDNIHKGIPITFFIQAQLWQEKKGWFDKTLESKIIIYKLGFDTWDRIYYLIFPSEESSKKQFKRSFLEIEALNSFIDEKNSFFLYSIDKLKEKTSYYITLKVNIKILTLKNLKEVESWLKGELKTAKEGSLSEEKTQESFSDRIFDLTLKLTGFKNQVLWEKSEVFTSEELEGNSK